MKLKYQAKKGNRVKYRFMGMTTFDYSLYFNKEEKKWQHIDEIINEDVAYSSSQECKSVRAFRRKLKKTPKGVEFILQSRWIGYDVIGVGNCMNF